MPNEMRAAVTAVSSPERMIEAELTKCRKDTRDSSGLARNIEAVQLRAARANDHVVAVIQASHAVLSACNELSANPRRDIAATILGWVRDGSQEALTQNSAAIGASGVRAMREAADEARSRAARVLDADDAKPAR